MGGCEHVEFGLFLRFSSSKTSLSPKSCIAGKGRIAYLPPNTSGARVPARWLGDPAWAHTVPVSPENRSHPAALSVSGQVTFLCLGLVELVKMNRDLPIAAHRREQQGTGTRHAARKLRTSRCP
jgi:hypothetical protein